MPRTTDSTHWQRYAPNLLLDQLRPTQTNWVWVNEITYLRLGVPMRFLVRIHQECGGLAGTADMPKALFARQRELLAQRPALGLIVYFDRGGQYVGNTYNALLPGAQARLSYSQRGDCYDNT